ncbi:hypothetical protein [Pantanalinema sp. GBBB05]|uniref:hypothetical protein n=1 Tax=Pantanalinema sp. GBBB05 TaxID=2604139 RepID=UPI001DF42A8F|nr:hypothetical protein [Pantanalinema sp. GBBB05]
MTTLTFNAQTALATVGLAEWQVYTPGGNVIVHADGWKEAYGDCLKADDADLALEPDQQRQVYVAYLKRWQYYNGYVAGENRQGFFLFNEVNKQVTYFASEPALLQAIARQNLGAPKSNWLTGYDGWIEAWFPVMIWKPCKQLLSPSPTGQTHQEFRLLSKAQCEKALSKASLSLYRETTWGRHCRRFQALPLEERQQQADLQIFCDQLLDDSL